MKYFGTLFFIMLIFTSFAQEEKKVSIHNVYLLNGSNYMTAPFEDPSVFQGMASESQILAQDLTGFTSSVLYPGMSGENSTTSLLIGLSFKDRENQILRLGINHRIGMYAHTNLSKTTKTPYDTLTSSQTGEQYFVDSIETTYIQGDAHSEYLGIEASMIFQTADEYRWSFFGGFGIGLGIAFNNEIRINEFNYNYASGFQSSYYESNSQRSEIFKADSYLSSTLFFPLGIDFRIGKNRPFWQRVHLLLELRPSLTVASIPEYTTVVNPAMNGNVGLRINW
jgi:hypothetical protein